MASVTATTISDTLGLESITSTAAAKTILATTPSKITTRAKAISITTATNSFMTITPNYLSITTTTPNNQDKDSAATGNTTVVSMITTRLLRRASNSAKGRTIAASAEPDNLDAVPQGILLPIIVAGSVVFVIAIIIVIVIVYIRKNKKDLSEDRYSFPHENNKSGYGNSDREVVRKHTSFAN
jgi:hypothetical protein